MKRPEDILGPVLLEMLGLPKDRCRSLTISMTVGEPVLVRAEYVPDQEDLMKREGEIHYTARRLRIVSVEEELEDRK